MPRRLEAINSSVQLSAVVGDVLQHVDIEHAVESSIGWQLVERSPHDLAAFGQFPILDLHGKQAGHLGVWLQAYPRALSVPGKAEQTRAASHTRPDFQDVRSQVGAIWRRKYVFQIVASEKISNSLPG